jgi:hypothetical protein
LRVPELDALDEKQKREVDPAKRRDPVWESQRKLLNTLHVIPVINSLGPGGLAREWVKNVPKPVVTGSNTYALDRVWLDK